jgi:uncharacterized repeat protein (TIGR01451 family)
MANFITRLLSKLRGRERRAENRRRLRIELMESREVMVSDLGAISGTVVTDTTDNGFDVGDSAVVGAVVQLFRDGTNLTFDNGAGDDTLIASATTDSTGAYTFNDLLEDRYYVRQLPVSGKLQRTAETVQTVDISASQAAGTSVTNIDNFNTTTQSLTANSGTPTDSNSAVTALNEAIGGERDLVVNYLSGLNDVQAQVTGGLLTVGGLGNTEGNAIVSYDGADADATTLNNTNGLNNLDLTTSGSLAFHLRAGAEATGNTLVVTVYSSPTNFSTHTVAMPVSATLSASEELLIRFSDFTVGGGTGAVFTSVNAIQFQINIVAGQETFVDFTDVVGRSSQTVNFLNLNPMSLGDVVFRDTNDNGLKESGETGISSVVVQLHNDSNSNGTYDNGTDTLVGSTTTNASGIYSFTDLLPGNYIAFIPQSQFAVSAPLFGFLPSSVVAGDPDTVVVNDDNNGATIAGIGVATAAITLASGTEPTNDGDTNVDSNLTLDFGMTPQIDLRVQKTGTTTIDAGGNVTYSLAITNNSPIAATNVVVTDDLPSGVTFVPNGTNGSTSSTIWTTQANTNAELIANIGTMAANAQQTLTVVVTVAAGTAAGGITNAATITGDGRETAINDNSSTANTTITRNAVLTLSKSDGTRTSVTPGDTFTYTLLVTNTGLSTANNVTLTDTLPAGYTFVSFTGTSQGNPQRTVVSGLDQITAGVTSLAVGATMTVGINVAVANSIAGTSIVNTATADSDDSTAVNASDTNTIVRNVNLRISKTPSSTTVGVGGKLTYTLAVTNDGPLDVTGIEVDDNLPTGFTLATTGNPSSVTNSPNATRDLLWTVGNLASQQTSTVQIIVDVASSFTPATNVINSATIAVDRLVGFTDTTVGDNTATAAVAVEPRYDLLITKDDTLTAVATGQSYAYTITVNNSGPSAASNVVVSDTLPTGIQFVSATSNGTNIGTATGQAYSATIPTLASGETRTITLNVRVLSSATGTSIANTATVTADNITTQETGTRANSATDTNTLNRTVTLNVTKTGPTTAVSADTTFTYTVIAFNSGNADAPSVAFTDPLPSGVTFVNGTFTVNGTSTTGNVTLNSTTNTLEASLGTLLAGGSATTNHATITLNMRAAATTSGTVQNTARVANPDNTTGVTSAASITVNPNFNLRVTKSDNLTTASVGQNLTYTIIVTNDGPSPASNISVTDTLPTSLLTFVSASSGFTNNNGSITGSIASLASGASSTITVTATVRNDVPNNTVISNNPVTISAAGEGPIVSDNTASDPTTIVSVKTISGFAFVDLNQNGVRDGSGDADETQAKYGIAGVRVVLNGTVNGTAITPQTATTDATGLYQFTNLSPGTYSVTAAQPTNFRDGTDAAGTAGGIAAAGEGNDQISGIPLAATDSTGNNFGENRLFSKRLFLASTDANGTVSL